MSFLQFQGDKCVVFVTQIVRSNVHDMFVADRASLFGALSLQPQRCFCKIILFEIRSIDEHNEKSKSSRERWDENITMFRLVFEQVLSHEISHITARLLFNMCIQKNTRSQPH
jgi:hypothetical protein